MCVLIDMCWWLLFTLQTRDMGYGPILYQTRALLIIYCDSMSCIVWQKFSVFTHQRANWNSSPEKEHRKTSFFILLFPLLIRFIISTFMCFLFAFQSVLFLCSSFLIALTLSAALESAHWHMRMWHWNRPQSCTFTSAGTNIFMQVRQV